MLRRCGSAILLTGLCAFAADLWTGIEDGPHKVGFRLERTTDPTRRTPLGIAIWYPAMPAAGAPMTQLDYRLQYYSRSLGAEARSAFLDSEAEMMVGWRHVG